MTKLLIKDLCKIAKISKRTLHYYDQVGLLKPSLRSDNNYRFYSEKDLLKLQQIIALKFLGFELSKIKQLLEHDVEINKHLDAQAHILQKKSDQLLAVNKALKEVIIDCKSSKSIDLTQITKLIEVYMNKDLSNANANMEKEYESLLINSPNGRLLNEYENFLVDNNIVTSREDYRQGIVDSAKNTNWEHYQVILKKLDAINDKLVKAIEDDIPASSEAVQELIKKQYALQYKQFNPTKENYLNGIKLFTEKVFSEGENLRDLLNKKHPKLVAYQVEAMKAFAERNLK